MIRMLLGGLGGLGGLSLGPLGPLGHLGHLVHADPLGHLPAPPPSIPSTIPQAAAVAASLDQSARRLARVTGVEADQWRRYGDFGHSPLPGWPAYPGYPPGHSPEGRFAGPGDGDDLDTMAPPSGMNDGAGPAPGGNGGGLEADRGYGDIDC